MGSVVTLTWQRFDNVIEALKKFKGVSCVYALTDKDERVLRVGETENFRKRYWGGTGWMLAAAMHGSGNLIFVAEAPQDTRLRRKVEALLTFRCQPLYNQQDKLRPPQDAPEVEHRGQLPRGIVGPNG